MSVRWNPSKALPLLFPNPTGFVDGSIPISPQVDFEQLAREWWASLSPDERLRADTVVPDA
jgi:hypothetical protein